MNRFENEKMWKLVLSLAIPSMIAQLVNVLYSIVDRMFVGQIPGIGNLCLAAVGVCGPIVTLLSSFGTLVGIGGSIRMSIRMGQKNIEKASQILFNSFVMLVCISITLTILFLCLKSNLIMWFGGSAQIFAYASTYLTIYTLGTFFALMAIGLNYFITCQGYAKTAMFTVVLGAITNIVLDFIFIKILNFGIAGAAWATVIAQVNSCLFALGFLLIKAPIPLRKNQMNRSVIWHIVKLGFSPFVILATDSVILIVMNTVLQNFGGNQGDILVGAVTIAQSYFLLITGPLIGITSGTQQIIAYNFGAKRLDRIKDGIKTIMMMGFSFCLVMLIISFTFSNVFVSMFTSDVNLMGPAQRIIKIFCSGILFMSVQYVLVDAITALSNVKLSLFLSLNRKMIYLLSTCLLPIIVGVNYTFYAQPIADFLASIVTTLCFVKIIPSYLLHHGLVA